MLRGPPHVSIDSILEATFVARHNPAFVVEWKSRRILAANEAVERVFGHRPDDLVGQTTELLHVDRPSFLQFGEMTEQALASGKGTFHGYSRLKRSNGEAFDAENLLGVIRDEAKQPIAAVSIVNDLSDAGGLRLGGNGEQNYFQALNDNLPGGVFQRVQYPRGTAFYRFIHGDLSARLGVAGAASEQTADRILGCLEDGERQRLDEALDQAGAGPPAVDLELRATSAEGQPRWLRTIAQARHLDDGSTVWDGIFIDLTDQRRAESALHELATYDPLTGLPNSNSFDQRLSDALVHGERSQTRVMVGALNIRRFHLINESLGYGYGDVALRAIGERLGNATAGNDAAARYQGDEFLLLMQDIRNLEEARSKAQGILSLFDDPLALDEGTVFSVKGQLGLSIFPDDAATVDDLRRCAELALHRTRAHSDRGYEFYASEMTEEALERLELERSLNDAIENGEIVPHYQPQYSTGDGSLVGFEALARWPCADGSSVSPGKFIPVAEESGLIRALGELVVRKVIADIRRWQHEGRSVPPVAINLSPHQVRQPGFYDWWVHTLGEHELAADAITLEITETAFLLDFEGTKANLDRLAEAGVCLSIDDFGTGFSSLSYLSELPFGELKIDQAFVAEMDDNPTKRAVAHSIVELGHALGLRVIAEGVETLTQLDMLSTMGCDGVQGFLFAAAEPANAISEACWVRMPHWPTPAESGPRAPE